MPRPPVDEPARGRVRAGLIAVTGLFGAGLHVVAVHAPGRGVPSAALDAPVEPRRPDAAVAPARPGRHRIGRRRRGAGPRPAQPARG